MLNTGSGGSSISIIPSSDFRNDEKRHQWKVPSVAELYPSGVPQQLDYLNIAASELLARSAALFPDHIVAEFLQREFSYQYIDRAAVKLAAWLHARDLHSYRMPAMLAALNQRVRVHRGCNPFDLSSLKWVISGVAALPAGVSSEFAHHSGAQVVEGYGLPEASPVTHVGPLDGSNQLGTIGLPLSNTECCIIELNDPNKDLSAGEVGELLIRALQFMLGYWKNEQTTAQIMQNGWFRTGDSAQCNSRGFHQILDRKKDLIITSIFHVYPTKKLSSFRLSNMVFTR
ncbi:MAG: AMP-binding protein [Planctomycetota bacterium]|nr:AMP-binding protein [Planctomycetota bacterium]